MDKKGMALVFALLITTVLSILLGSFFIGSVTDNNLAKRYVGSLKAFWLAEAGIAEALINMPFNTSGSVGGAGYTYSATTSLLTGDYYRIDSIGSAQVPPSGSPLTRLLRATVRTDPVDPNNFQHAIRSTVELRILGSVDITGDTEEFASLNFPDLFEHSKEEIKSYADHLYTDPPNDVLPVDGITWVDLSPGEEMIISSETWSGSGILVVAGDCQITGGYFRGIIYVIGELRMSGSPTVEGTILAESDAELDTTLTGNITISYDFDAIVDALNPLQFISPEVVSWQDLS